MLYTDTEGMGKEPALVWERRVAAMEIRSDDFQKIYRRYAYPLYREVFEELGDVGETREVLYRVFTRLREEGLEEGFDLEQRIQAYKSEYVREQKQARLDVERVWYQMRSDEITGGRPGNRAEEAAGGDADPGEENPEAAEAAAPAAEVSSVPDEVPAETALPEPAPAEIGSEAETDPAAADPVEERLRDLSIDELLEDISRSARKRHRLRMSLLEESGESAENREPQPAEIRSEAETRERAEAAPETAVPENGAVRTEQETESGDESGAERTKAKGMAGYWILLAVVLVLFLWLFLSILMSMEVLPAVDLGYTWFNEHIFALFPVP